ncbi:MAG: hypothetical protein FWC56_06400 [Phycisphaerae bacterium]|nr:hypothetical protein [Phycisphaerae bacterium]
MGRGNPAFLLDYLLDCFLDYFIWIASLIPAHGMGLAMTRYKENGIKSENFWQTLWTPL